MGAKESNAYILDTDKEELRRLGIQHQVWASEAQKGWEIAKFNLGHTILDLGSGPGFCTKELAYIVGDEGKVIAVDRSASYIKFVEKIKKLHSLSIETFNIDFDDIDLQKDSIDGMYCRWALAWVKDPKSILNKIHHALKPGGKMVIQEYYDWSTHQTEPGLQHLNKAIAAALKSFKEQEGEIDIGREIPGILASMGMRIVSLRLMSKLARPNEHIWNWPKSFYHSYFPNLVKMKYLTKAEVEKAFADLKIIEATAGATLCTPIMIEIVAEKQ
jgi:ubiquinone/menaquinone biosynthesis C-methylase UbiE